MAGQTLKKNVHRSNCLGRKTQFNFEGEKGGFFLLCNSIPSPSLAFDLCTKVEKFVCSRTDPFAINKLLLSLPQWSAFKNTAHFAMSH